VAEASDTVTGYVEYYYWKNFYAKNVMDAKNWAEFSDVEMYRDKSDTSVNMEYLFNLGSPFVEGEDDPPANSLFNLTTLQTIVCLGNATPNIVGADKDKIYGVDFTLSQDWVNLANLLELYDEGTEHSGIAVKRTYMIWLWMTTLWDQTFARKPDGGSYQMGIIGTLGATALSTEM
jgi:hypothetical protein